MSDKKKEPKKENPWAPEQPEFNEAAKQPKAKDPNVIKNDDHEHVKIHKHRNAIALSLGHKEAHLLKHTPAVHFNKEQAIEFHDALAEAIDDLD